MAGMRAANSNQNSKSMVEVELDKKAREVNLGKNLTSEQLYNVILQMKLQTDKCRREKTKQIKELAVYYKRFIIFAQENVIPDMLKNPANMQKI